ncbi:OmpA family protein [Flagellimonas aequoris]|uniref:OmpA family protein n=1 Tax=Flagellimonas aequoris TaxID=2306997 RepID=A0A418NC10_9FLAO|nr:OmpA family protein [Allomuricauda aequoris]RIV73842.1 OmpA family protein [Allomuricauda aequoris]TXK07529.1 OmpA family protein [Allomuricauda aequoris]
MNKANNIRLAFLAFLIGMVLCSAQARKSKGDAFFFQYEYQKAIVAYEQELVNGTLSEKQFLNLADSYFKVKNFKKASEAYLELFKKDTLMDGHHYNKMLQSLSKTSDKERKEAFLSTVAASFPKELMENMDFNEQMLQNESKDSVTYKFFNLASNSPQTDFAPSFYNTKLLFSSGRDQDKRYMYAPGNEGYFKIYESKIQPNGQVTSIQPFHKIAKSKFHQATPYYSNKLNKVFYVSSNTEDAELVFDSKGKNALAIGMQAIDGGFQLLLKDLSTSFYYPFYDDTNGKLYFSADFEGGYGGTDIYYVYTSNGQIMSAPINLGPRINSPGNEVAPYIFEDSFYFASDVFYGLGGMDIYKANIESEGFGIPINLGKGINTEFDDFGFVIRNEGEGLLGYFASNRPGGKGKDDLYGFKVDEKPGLKTITFKGKVVKPYGRNEAVAKAVVRLKGTNGELLSETYSDEEGNYRLEIPWTSAVTLESTSERYSTYKKQFTEEDLQELANTDAYNVELSLYDDLVEEKEGQKVVKMDKFYFGNSSTQLTPEIDSQLDKVVSFMNAFPDAQLRIETYTDSRGGSSTNFKLTQGRSDAIKRYLVGQGVSATSILYSIGYGEEKILNNCTNGVFCIETLHKQNQRSLIVVLNDNVLFD